MKKNTLICAVLFLFGLLFVSSQALASGNDGQAEALFNRGLLSYNQKDYSKAGEDFTKALALNPQHQAAAYFAGLSHFNSENYTQALHYFEKVHQLDAQNAEVPLYEGIIHYRQNELAKAEASFKQVLALSQKETSRNLAQSYLRKLKGGSPVADQQATPQSGPRPWFVYGSVTTQYDSNVSLNPENLTLATLPSDHNDIGWQFLLGGGYHLHQSKSSRFTTEAYYAQSVYAELDDFNYGLIHVGTNLQLSHGKVSFQLPFSYEYSYLSTSSYLHSIAFKPQANYAPSSWLLLSFSPQATYNNFVQAASTAAQDRDAWNLQPELSGYFFLNKKQTRYFKVGYAYEGNFASGADWDYDAHWAKIAFSSPLFWKISTSVSANFMVDKTFDNTDSVIGTRRNDFAANCGIALSRPIIGPLTGQISYHYYHNSSNQAFFESNRHIAGATLSVSY